MFGQRKVEIGFVMESDIKSKGVLQGEALMLDEKKEKPRLVKRYLYSLERDFIMSGMQVLFWTGGVISGLCVKEPIIAVLSGIWDILLIKVLVGEMIELNHIKMQERKTILLGKKCPAKIIAYEVEPLVQYKKKVPSTKEILYYLHVQFVYKGNTRTIHTPALLYNPLAVLKSTNCVVYIHGSQFTVTEYDFRTDKNSEKIKLKRIMNWERINC